VLSYFLTIINDKDEFRNLDFQAKAVFLCFFFSVSELGAGAGDQLRSASATSGAFAELSFYFKSRKELD